MGRLREGVVRVTRGTRVTRVTRGTWVTRLARGARSAVTRVMIATTTLATIARPALGATYDVFVALEHEDEDELVELYLEDVITESELRSLTRMLRKRVNLNVASREQLYALPNLTYDDVDALLAFRQDEGTIGDIAELVAAGSLSARKARAIAPFAKIDIDQAKSWRGSDAAVTGVARLRSVWVVDTPDAPAAALQLGIDSGYDVSAGMAALLTRHRLGDVSFDARRGALTASPPFAQIQVPKYYVFWRNERFELAVGTYRIGFGQRLTFDTTDHYTPNGIEPDDSVDSPGTKLGIACKRSTGELDASPCAGEEASRYTTPDFGWSASQRGIAAGARRLEFRGAWMQIYAFASYQDRSIYQYEIYDRSKCHAPRLATGVASSDDDECTAPRLYERQDNAALPAPGLSYYVLPDVYTEALAGGNLTLFTDRRTHVGVTGYGSIVSWNVDELDLDFQGWSALPSGGAFGALGVDAAWGVGAVDVFAEATRSFDRAGGGYAGLLRSTATFGQQALEVSVRYYDSAFANPYAGPISAADEFEGNRARDEAGARVRYVGAVLPQLDIRARADVWHELSEGTPKFDVGLRGDYQMSPALLWSLWADYQTPLSLATCIESRSVVAEADDGTCQGQRVRASGAVGFEPASRLRLSAQYRHSFFDVGQPGQTSGQKMREDAALALAASGWISDGLGLRARYRFRFDDIADASHLEQSHWVTAALTLRHEGALQIQARYDFVQYTDGRDSTAQRTPNPEHWLWLTLTTRL